MIEQPEFEHDCDKCVFLGRYLHDSASYDLYVCKQSRLQSHPDLPEAFVARFGNREKYLSLPAWILEMGPPSLPGTLLEAKRRFKQQKDEK